MIHLLIMVSMFTLCKTDLACMYLKYDDCYKQANETTLSVYCIDAPRKALCLEDKARHCHVENETVVQNFIAGYLEVCKEGTQLHEMYMKHMDCGFNAFLQSIKNQTCFNEISSAAVDGDEVMEHFKFFCRSFDRMNGCIRSKINEACGEEADYFYCKVFGPGDELEDNACIEIGAIQRGVDRTCQYNGANKIFGNLKSIILLIVPVLFMLNFEIARNN